MITILIFIIILLVLVLIHEGGHFFAAKISKTRVDEFAFGFPPRLFSIKKGETTYAFNALPLGGYVKIHGENGEEENEEKENKNIKNTRNFSKKHPFIKIFILIAGVFMNLVLAYLLITFATYINTTFSIDRESQEYKTFLNEGRIEKEETIIGNVLENSPASLAKLSVGDKVYNIFLNEENSSGEIISKKSVDLDASGEALTDEISKSINDKNNKFNNSITIDYQNKKGELNSTTIAGVYGLDDNMSKKMIGISFEKSATINLKFSEAIKLGWENTIEYTKLTLIGFKDLFVDLFSKGELSKNVAGPVGMVKEVGGVREMGFNYLLLFTAALSISLAVFNILPFPALDGGRILFVLIEWITGKKIKEKWQNILNGTGFVLLILLMIFVTVKDVMKLF